MTVMLASTRSAARPNFDLKEEIRAYWSERAKSFDQDFGHGIHSEAEFLAWQQPLREALGTEPLQVLELGCGTGEITRPIHDLGHDVTALDFSEEMLIAARTKLAGKPRLRFLLGDAERTMQPDAVFDAIVCRHLVWTLTEPTVAFRDWLRILRPGGTLIVYDGDWATPSVTGRIAAWLIRSFDHWKGPAPDYLGSLGAQHDAIMHGLPFRHGLRFGALADLLRDAGFGDIDRRSHAPIARAQRKSAGLRDKLRTRIYRRFILTAARPRTCQTRILTRDDEDRHGTNR